MGSKQRIPTSALPEVHPQHNFKRRIKMLLFDVEIRGITPLLIHRFGEQSEQAGKTRRMESRNVDPREEATRHAYIAANGTYFFSAFAIVGALSNAGASHKVTGSRKSLRFVIPSAVSLTADTITILNGAGPATHFEVDSRPVTIPATKGRIMRHRPRFDQWGARFPLLIDDALIDPKTVNTLLAEAGQSIGVGDFRPEKRGPFGRFNVVQFKESVKKK
jgi:hypothetical protein